MLLCILSLSFAACKPQSAQGDENTVVIRPNEEVLVLGETTSLMDYLAAMQDKGLLTFTANNGMIDSVNGIENQTSSANSGSYWMIYTSDPDFSEASYGTLDYQGETYASATVGAEQLIVSIDYVYLLAYQSVTW